MAKTRDVAAGGIRPLSETRDRLFRALGVLILVVAFVFPFLPTTSGYWLRVGTLFIMLATMAQAWNLIGGFTGYPAFGNVAFFGIGAYACGILMNRGWPFLAAFPVAGLIAALFAFLVGLPVLRLKGHYFAIATLGIAEASREIVADWDSLTGGGTGLTFPISYSDFFFKGIYFAMLGVLLALLIFTFLARRGRLGYAWVAIREDEDAARMMGINTTVYKSIAFSLSALFTGLVGGIYGFWVTAIVPEDTFAIHYTLEMIVASIIGGTGTVFGPLVGAAIFEVIRTYLWASFREVHQAFLGAAIVLVVLFMPRGLMPYLTGQIKLTRDALLENIRRHRV